MFFNMKCKFLLGLFATAMAFSALGQGVDGFYENDALVQAPPDIIPNVDATNFVNRAHFILTFTNQIPFDPPPQLPYPFETQDTINYSNVGVSAFLSCNTGFRFETFNPLVGQRQPAGSVFNDGIIHCGTIDTSNTFSFFSFGSSIFFFGTVSGAKFIASATNIVNHGEIDMGFDSLLSLKGDSIDMERGVLTMETSGFSAQNLGLFFNGGIFDNYLGAGLNNKCLCPPS